MAFEEITKGAHAEGGIAHRVTINKMKNGGAMICISRDLLREMGEPTTVSLSRGNGEHAGLVLVKPASAGSENAYKFHFQSANSAGQIGTSPKKLGIPSSAGSFPTTECEHEMTDDGLVFRIPDFSNLAVAAE